jgi:hypothetical protein
MNDKKLKHLEFIQSTISRMGNNSFIIKGWLITLVSALYALAAKDANLNYVFVTYFAIPTFWGIDGYFISQERKFRSLYDVVRLKEENDIDFDMNNKLYHNHENSWLASMYSVAIYPLYVITLIITLTVMFLIDF